MKNIIIINTGGTFNKVYNPISGNNEIQNYIVKSILKKWNANYEVFDIIQKDSLDINDEDRKKLLDLINSHPDNRIVVIHGTDTMTRTAKFIHENTILRSIVFTGSMTPYSMENTEAAANLAASIGFLRNHPVGVFISMGDIVGICWQIEKNLKKGCFQFK